MLGLVEHSLCSVIRLLILQILSLSSRVSLASAWANEFLILFRLEEEECFTVFQVLPEDETLLFVQHFLNLLLLFLFTLDTAALLLGSIWSCCFGLDIVPLIA